MTHPFSLLTSLSPIGTGVAPKLPKLPHVKAVIFDVYGTLIISASGDIGCNKLRGEIAIKSFEQAGLCWETEHSSLKVGEWVIQAYEKHIREHHEEARLQGSPHPEVDIVEIWKKTLHSLHFDHHVLISNADNAPIDFEQLAIHFETCTNAVFPMPHMEDCLEKLSGLGFQLGIVSNAQFFTPMVLNHFMSHPYRQALPHFNPDLQVYSYQHGRAKPDVFLYQQLEKQLKKYDLVPEQCLYIGNDMLNDIYPASKVGFKTALYAGDERSLRWRKDDQRCQHLQPDAIITSLKQIFSIVER